MLNFATELYRIRQALRSRNLTICQTGLPIGHLKIPSWLHWWSIFRTRCFIREIRLAELRVLLSVCTGRIGMRGQRRTIRPSPNRIVFPLRKTWKFFLEASRLCLASEKLQVAPSCSSRKSRKIPFLFMFCSNWMETLRPLQSGIMMER